MAALLVQVIEGTPVERVTRLATELVERDSA